MDDAQPSGPARLILLIEDDVGVGEVMRAALSEEGYQVVLSRHALSVVEVARLRPHLLILDLILDHDDAGWDLLLALADDAGTAQIPVVICTAHDALVRREEARLQTLAAAVVRKPFALDDLLAAIHAALATSESAAEAPLSVTTFLPMSPAWDPTAPASG